MNITAKDLMILFNSFKPQNGVIIKVSVYPSEFGKKMMKSEEAQGP